MKAGVLLTLTLAIAPLLGAAQTQVNKAGWSELGFRSIDEPQLGSTATWRILPQDFSISPGTWGPPRPRFPRRESPEMYSAELESLASTSLVRASVTWLNDVRWYGSKD